MELRELITLFFCAFLLELMEYQEQKLRHLRVSGMKF